MYISKAEMIDKGLYILYDCIAKTTRYYMTETECNRIFCDLYSEDTAKLKKLTDTMYGIFKK